MHSGRMCQHCKSQTHTTPFSTHCLYAMCPAAFILIRLMYGLRGLLSRLTPLLFRRHCIMSVGKQLIWVDLEMTGLDVDVDHIMEMSCIITDKDLNIQAEGPTVVIHVEDSVLDGMGEWCKTHHRKSGLTDACRKSVISLPTAEELMLDFVMKHTTKGECPLAGNTIYMDKIFLMKYMPRFVDHLHYRLVDVSTVKELASRWYPFAHASAPVKKGSHRTLSDIKDSIQELQYYRQKIFKD